MNNAVRETIKRHNLIEKGDRVIVALSGGADSSALLRVLLSIQAEYDLTLYCAHVNHQLRGEESERDEAFVRDICRDLSLELFVRHVDVRALSKERKISEELCGRNVRYEFFSELSEKYGAKVATAHTLSDCEETMLFNIARGTSLHGLSSIPYKRDFIIRPLLDVTRDQVEEYMKEGNFPFVNDSTNFSEDVCSRNKIRLSVLPELTVINEGFHKNFMKLRKKLTAADDFIRESAIGLLKEAETPFGFSSEVLLSSHKAVLDTALAMCIAKAGLSPSDSFISLLSGILETSGAVPLSKDFFAVCTQGTLRIVKACESEDFAPCVFAEGIEFTHRGEKYKVVKVRECDTEEESPFAFRIPCEKVTPETVLRRRMPEDTFRPLSRGLKKSLRKLQNEMKIPSELRGESLIVARGSTVLWAEHIGLSEDGISPSSSEYLQLRKVSS